MPDQYTQQANNANAYVTGYTDNPNGTTTNILNDGTTSTVKYSKNADGSLTPTEVASSPVIPVDQISNQSKINIPNPQPTADNSQALVNTAAGTSKSLQDYITQLTPPTTALDSQNQAILDKIASLTGQDTGKEAYRATQEAQNGANDLQRQLTDLNGQITTGNAEYQQLLTQENNALSKIQGTAIFGDEMTADQRAASRNFAVLKASKAADLAILSARAQATQGNLQTALTLADRAVTAKYAPIEDEIKVKQAQLQAIQPMLDKQDKIQSLAMQRKYEDDKQAIQDKKDNEKAINEIIINASAQGAPQDIVQKAAQAKTPLEATKILGRYSGDFMKYEMLKEQIRSEKENQATQRAQRGLIAANIAKTKAETEKTQSETMINIGKATNSGNDQLKTQAATAAQQLLNDFRQGKGYWTTGRLSALPNVLSAGTPAADFRAKYNQLSSLLNLDNIKYLKGSGQISDAEERMLRQAGTSLSLDMTDKEFENTLIEVNKALGNSDFNLALPDNIGATGAFQGTSIIGGSTSQGLMFNIPNK